MKEDTKSAVALAHSRECTKELISGLPNFGSMETFGARHKNEMSPGKKRRQTCFYLLRDFFFVFSGQCNTGVISVSSSIRAWVVWSWQENEEGSRIETRKGELQP